MGPWKQAMLYIEVTVLCLLSHEIFGPPGSGYEHPSLSLALIPLSTSCMMAACPWGGGVGCYKDMTLTCLDFVQALLSLERNMGESGIWVRFRPISHQPQSWDTACPPTPHLRACRAGGTKSLLGNPSPFSLSPCLFLLWHHGSAAFE